MSDKEILKLAWEKSVDLWAIEQNHVKENPENELARAREQKAWTRQQELHTMLMNAEKTDAQKIEESIARLVRKLGADSVSERMYGEMM